MCSYVCMFISSPEIKAPALPIPSASGSDIVLLPA